MAVVKCDVDLATLAHSEVCRVCSSVFRLGTVESARKLNGGYGSVNYLVTLDNSVRVVLKVAVVEKAECSARTQAAIMTSLAGAGFGLVPKVLPIPHQEGFVASCKTEQGSHGWSLVLEFRAGVPANLRIADPACSASIAESLGSALGRLHSVRAEVSPGNLAIDDQGWLESYMHCGPNGLAELTQHQTLADHPYVAFVASRTARLAEILKRAKDTLPRGLIHGDPYADNLLCDEVALSPTALLDWEDACEGPLVYDLATAVVGGCFDADGVLQTNRVAPLLRGYEAERILDAKEWEMLPELCWVNALACGAYRFRQFNLAQPDAPKDARESYREMQTMVEALEGETLPACILGAARNGAAGVA